MFDFQRPLQAIHSRLMHVVHMVLMTAKPYSIKVMKAIYAMTPVESVLFS